MRVAILPAGGRGTRMKDYSPTPKQLLSLKDGLVIDYALGAARYCGAWPHIIVPPGNERVSRYVESKLGFCSFSYAAPNLLASVYALKPVYREAQIIYMMPDTIFEPLSAVNTMLMRLDFPVVVGVAPTSTPSKLGMCVLSSEPDDFGTARIVAVEDKPTNWNRVPAAWGLLAWRTPFWECLAQTKADNMTEVVARAIEMFGPLPTVWLNRYIDIGTPGDYERALAEGW